MLTMFRVLGYVANVLLVAFWQAVLLEPKSVSRLKMDRSMV